MLQRAWRHGYIALLRWGLRDIKHRQRQLARQMVADRDALHRMCVQEMHDSARVSALLADLDALRRQP